VGLAGRRFNTGYKEHIRAVRNNHSNSEYLNYKLIGGHKYGTTAGTMDVMTGKKGKHLNTLERYHIYLTKKYNIHMNETHIYTFNPIFESLYELQNRQQHVLPPHS
jgi:hypothetical protein